MNTIEVAEIVNGRQLHKFGGSSLMDVDCYLRVARIIAKHSQPDDIIVVSAAGNTTNQLINWIKISQNHHQSLYQIQQSLHNYHTELISGLLPPEIALPLISKFIYDLRYSAVMLNNKITDQGYAAVVGQGEIWSARLMAALLNNLAVQSVWLDARDFLRAERSVQPKVDKCSSYPLLQNLLAQYPGKRLVVTGFISSNYAGETVLLGRNGSDYSATQIGALAGVVRVTIWSDVAGVYSADPRKVKDACLLPSLRLDEASELARLAAPVLHARTLQPLSDSNIDLWLRCSYRSEQVATRIERIFNYGMGSKIITSHDDICLIELRVSRKCDFRFIQQELELIVKHSQIKPLVVGIDQDHNVLQLYYTSEVAEGMLQMLCNSALPCKLQLRKRLGLLAIVGAGVSKNKFYIHCLYEHLKGQPVEFIWQAEDGISLVVILSQAPGSMLLQGLHKSLYRAEKHIGLVFCEIGSSMSSY